MTQHQPFVRTSEGSLDATGEALVTAALNVLQREGVGALTVRRIAAEASLSTMNVYSRFGSKEGVLNELFRRGCLMLFERFDEVGESDSLSRDFMQLATVYRTFALDYPEVFRLIFRGGFTSFTLDPSTFELGLSGLNRMIERIERAQQSGRVLSDRSALDILMTVWSSCHGLVVLQEDQVGEVIPDWDELWRATTQLVISSVVINDEAAK